MRYRLVKKNGMVQPGMILEHPISTIQLPLPDPLTKDATQTYNDE